MRHGAEWRHSRQRGLSSGGYIASTLREPALVNSVSIRLGHIELRDFEVPPYITYGGNYRVSVQRLASGHRVFERLGSDDTDIRFAGTFSGPDAAHRARAVDAMRLAGKPVWLTWASLRYRVVMRSLFLRFKNPQWVEYQARCIVISEPGFAAIDTLSSSAQSLADLANATAALPAYTTEFAPLGSAIAADDAFTPGTTNALVATNAAMLVKSTLDGFITANNDVVASTDFARDSGFMSEQFLSVITAAGQLASGIISQNYIGRISRALIDIEV